METAGQNIVRKLVFSNEERSAGSYTESEPNDTVPPPVLDPNHPLLAKFQQALKHHLERQIEHLSNEVFELETSAKKKLQAREALGIDTYEAQQMIDTQQRAIGECMSELDNVYAGREEMENLLEEADEVCQQKKHQLMEAEKTEMGMCNEVEALDLLIHQMKKWETDMESELTINQRVYEKTKKDQQALAQGKRFLDALIFKLMSENFRLEGELETLDMQLRSKELEREDLAERVAASNIDVDTVNAEYRCLLHSWNSVVVAISARDRQFTNAKDQIDKMNEQLRSLRAEMQKVKKLCKQEQVQNERLTEFKNRIESDIESTRKRLEEENDKRARIELQLDADQTIIEQMERDIKKAFADNCYKSAELNSLLKDGDTFENRKVSLEEKIMRKLEEQTTNDKAAKYMTKLLNEIKTKNRDLVITLSNLENTIAKINMDIEAQRCQNEEMRRFLDELIKQMEEVEVELNQTQAGVGHMHTIAGKKQRRIDIVNSKLEKLLAKTGGVAISQEQLKINFLEKKIEDLKENVKELQKFWLREQTHVVGLSEQRQKQIQDMNLLKKQILILRQKNLRITDDLNHYQNLEEKLNRSITKYQSQIVILNNKLFDKKGHRESMGKHNVVIHNEYMGKLQDLELEALRLEADITQVEEDKATLSNELIEVNREALAWEKKIQMCVEAKQTLDKERSEGGEVGNMKAEIHRMEVRYGQLRKIQDKLIQDLEHCVSRRDGMVTLAEAREKKTAGGFEKTRINFNRKVADIKNKLKQLDTELENLDKKKEQADGEERERNDEVKYVLEDIDDLNRNIREVEGKTEVAKTDRLKYHSLVLLKQRKVNMYSELARGRSPYILYRTESVINAEYSKQLDTATRLSNVIDNLLSDFPNYMHVLIRVHNIIQAVLSF